MAKETRCFVEIEGETPLLMHNGRTANPLDEFAKKMRIITSKKKKTEEDLENLMSIQWEAGLYWNDELGVYMPVENLLAALLKACKKHKLGTYVSGFVFTEKLGFPLIANHAQNFELLKNDKENKFVKAVTIQRAKNLTCRPVFNKWGLKFNFIVDLALLTESDVTMILNTMTNRVGLGVWTPSHPKPGNFGKFTIKNIEFN